MKMKNIIRLTLHGIMIWLIPFISAFFFFDQTGQIAVDMYLFKTVMILIGGLTGAFAIVIYFRKVQSGFVNQGIIIGIVWFVVNFILDLAILLPISGMNYSDYLVQIGLRYLMIPIMSIMAGVLLEKKPILKKAV